MKTNIEIIRHSLSHLLAMAVLDMDADKRGQDADYRGKETIKFGIGPVIENGFYYDFDLPTALSPEDLPKLEKAMRHLINKGIAFERKEISAKEAQEIFKNQPYKLELIKELAEKGEKISIYTASPSAQSKSNPRLSAFVDLCAGPHIESAKEIVADAFKLTKTAGAYWRGDEKNKMLTRIYGVAFETKEALENHFKMLEEAEKRDHRKLGRDLDLFHIDEKVGLGLPLWHPKGAMLWRQIEDFWYKEHMKNGYDLVRSPHIGHHNLWETSGHWGFYNASMYPPFEVGQTLEARQKNEKVKESEEYLLKPMNCPFHVQIFKNSPKSYRDFPMRWAECGTVYRYEKKGELSGLTRVRGFTQDDAHIICRADQVEDELKKVVDFILHIFKSFGFNTDLINVYLSLRDPNNKDKYVGSDAGWELAENTLKKVALEKNLNFKEEKGEAAFYGPKLDFKLKDVIGREWQCSTLQFDFNLPERFDMTFTASSGESERPFMLHRALFGSFERFIALLIEHYGGAFPLWLSPVQIKILPVSDKFNDYAESVAEELKKEDVRVEVDSRSESLGKKIREGEKEKVFYLLIVGEKEKSENKVAVRVRGKGDEGVMEIAKFVERIKEEVKDKK